MSVVKETSRCPYCQETIASGAVICKHCHSKLTRQKKPVFNKYNNFRLGFLSGLVFTVVLTLLIYIQFFYE